MNKLGHVVELHAVDLAVCSAWVLDPVWLFNGHLNFDDVERALAWLITVFPEIGGRMTTRGIVLNNQGASLSEAHATVAIHGGSTRRTHPSQRAKSAFDFAAPGAPEPPRGYLTDLTDATEIRKGEGPLITMRLTRFADGTSALGVCLSHAVCDGYGAYTLLLLFAKALSRKTAAELRALTAHVHDKGYTLSRRCLKALSPVPAQLFAPEVLDAIARQLTERVGARRVRVQLTHGDLSLLRQRFRRLGAGGVMDGGVGVKGGGGDEGGEGQGGREEAGGTGGVAGGVVGRGGGRGGGAGATCNEMLLGVVSWAVGRQLVSVSGGQRLEGTQLVMTANMRSRVSLAARESVKLFTKQFVTKQLAQSLLPLNRQPEAAVGGGGWKGCVCAGGREWKKAWV